MSDTSSASTLKTPLAIAIIGCGNIGSLLARFIHRDRGARLIAVCDIDRTKVELLAREVNAGAFIDFRVLLNSTAPDIVIVATSDQHHVEPVIAALEAGCNVFCEKPLATTYAEARRLQAIAERCNRFLAVDYNRRFGHGYLWAQDLIQRKEIGPVRQIAIHVSDRKPHSAVVTYPQVMLTTLLTHHIDLVRCLAGEITSVWAKQGPIRAGLVEEITLCLTTTSGAIATMSGVYRSEQSRTSEVTIISGELGEIRVLDPTGTVEWWTSTPDCRTLSQPDPFTGGNAFESTITSHWNEFCTRCAQGQKPTVSALDGVRGLQVVEAALTSLASECVVSLESDSDDLAEGI